MKISHTLFAFSATALSLSIPHTALSQGVVLNQNLAKRTVQQNTGVRTVNRAPTRQSQITMQTTPVWKNPGIVSQGNITNAPLSTIRRVKEVRQPTLTVPTPVRLDSSEQGANSNSAPWWTPSGSPVTAKLVPTTIPLGPDLVVTNFKLTSEAINQGSFWGYKVEVTILNKGSAFAPPCPFVIIVEKTEGPGAFNERPCWDLSHNWTTGKSLAPLESVKVQSATVIPETWKVLKGTLRARVNATQNSGHSAGAILPGGVKETNEQNNTSAKISFVNPFLK